MLLCDFGICNLAKHVRLFQMDDAAEGRRTGAVMFNSTDVGLAVSGSEDFVNPASEEPG
jgi:hypothetical protein